MCDEYEDERMWAFWRRLEVMEELKRPEHEPAESELPATPLGPAILEDRKVRPRPLPR
jgi:hypothetical protein